MTTLLKPLSACPRCDGQLRSTSDGPQCRHCGHGVKSEEPAPPVGPFYPEAVEDTGILQADTGCEIAPACLDCPQPRCKHELGNGIAEARRLVAMLGRVSIIRNEGITAAVAAERYGVSIRTVFRWLRAFGEAA